MIVNLKTDTEMEICRFADELSSAGIAFENLQLVDGIWQLECTGDVEPRVLAVLDAPASEAAGCYMHTCGIATIPAGKKIKIAAVCAGSGGSFRVAGGSYKTYLRVQKL